MQHEIRGTLIELVPVCTRSHRVVYIVPPADVLRLVVGPHVELDRVIAFPGPRGSKEYDARGIEPMCVGHVLALLFRRGRCLLVYHVVDD